MKSYAKFTAAAAMVISGGLIALTAPTAPVARAEVELDERDGCANVTLPVMVSAPLAKDVQTPQDASEPSDGVDALETADQPAEATTAPQATPEPASAPDPEPAPVVEQPVKQAATTVPVPAEPRRSWIEGCGLSHSIDVSDPSWRPEGDVIWLAHGDLDFTTGEFGMLHGHSYGGIFEPVRSSFPVGSTFRVWDVHGTEKTFRVEARDVVPAGSFYPRPGYMHSETIMMQCCYDESGANRVTLYAKMI